MVAAIALAVSRGETLREAARFGVAAGAAAMILPGTEVRRPENTERLYERLDRGRLGWRPGRQEPDENRARI